MLTEYKTVRAGGVGEIAEKKSKFIATVFAVSTEEEALAVIERTKKRYRDASHNCFAYVLGKRQECKRCSDDGEPGGTAGRPMLEVLEGEGLSDVAVVVTRYFGGTLLGTGGLVRAYSQAVRAGLSSSEIITKIRAVKLKINTDYTGLGKIQYILDQKELSIQDSIYSDQVELVVPVPAALLEQVKSEITEGTAGQAAVTEEEPCWLEQIVDPKKGE